MTLNTQEYKDLQSTIMRELCTTPVRDAKGERKARQTFLENYLTNAAAKSYVLGISGGVDSSTAGALAQNAVENLRAAGYEAEFIAVRLPYGEQRDEADAQRALEFIKPDRVLTVNIKPSVDAAMAQLEEAGLTFKDAAHRDFVMGNIKARERMIVQYAIAGATNGLVIGTDHASEALMGFFTKFGDGACDLTPLSGLTKRQVRELATALGAPADLVNKPPTADLESLNPGLLDEVSFGVSYEENSDFLEGKIVNPVSAMKMIDAYYKTAHKRALPVGA